ncbi:MULTISPECIES: NRDE family protein [Cupriavidus]|uniref:NRDE family protein n=1 Tax=Cupriavidus sp. WS TaxID=1312922 RepID=UPI0003790B02|nr:NRDE family protein [Cupriavidus sp. WS]
MCLILVAWQSHPDYALVVAGNRDEFYARPAAPVHWWEDAPQVLAGRDMAEVIGEPGTWMGLAGDGRFAALTNYRAPSEKRTDARSRGELVAGFLRGDSDPHAYLAGLAPRAGVYNGFNLLTCDLRELWWYSNRGSRGAAAQPQRLKAGLYGLSNALLDTPWPKVVSRVGALAETLAADTGQTGASAEPYFDLLADTRQALDFELPRTGVTPEWERLLSSAFIRSPSYGTRASTVLRVRHDGRFELSERSFDANGRTGEVSYRGRLRVSRDAGQVPAP